MSCPNAFKSHLVYPPTLNKNKSREPSGSQSHNGRSIRVIANSICLITAIGKHIRSQRASDHEEIRLLWTDNKELSPAQVH